MNCIVENWTWAGYAVSVCFEQSPEPPDYRRSWIKQAYILNIGRIVGIECYDYVTFDPQIEPPKRNVKFYVRVDFGGEENSYTLLFKNMAARTKFVNEIFNRI